MIAGNWVNSSSNFKRAYCPFFRAGPTVGVQALLFASTERGVGDVLGASLCLFPNNYPGAEEVQEIDYSSVAGMAGEQKVARGGCTLQWWGCLNQEACTEHLSNGKS